MAAVVTVGRPIDPALLPPVLRDSPCIDLYRSVLTWKKNLSEHGGDRKGGFALLTASFIEPWELGIYPMESLLGYSFLNFHLLWPILPNYVRGKEVA